jgi:hypothetical protein
LIIEEDRKLIEYEIRTNGGNYHPDLSRQCTHLICASSSGNKYEAALKWGIHCVGVEWLYQSIERGMALESQYFAINIAPERRGEGAWNRDAALRLTAPSGLSSFDKVVSTDFENGVRKRRLRRAGSKIAQEGIWEGILNGVTDTRTLDIDETSMEMQLEDKSLEPVPVLEPIIDTLGVADLDHVPLGLFSGLIFYTWGFKDQKVPLF